MQPTRTESAQFDRGLLDVAPDQMIETISCNPADFERVAAPENHSQKVQADVPGAGPRQLPGALLWRAVPLALVIAALGWSYAPNLRSLVSTWTRDPNYSHGFLVIPVALIILWRRWADPEPPASAPRPWGWAALAAVLALRAALYERGSDWSETATLL